MPGRNGWGAARLALAAACTAVATVMLAPIVAPLASAALPWGGGGLGLLDMASVLTDPDGLAAALLGYTARLAAGGHVVELAATAAVAGGLVALSARGAGMGGRREVRRGILGRQESVSGAKGLLEAASPWDGEGEPAPGVAVGCVGGEVLLLPCHHAVLVAPSGSRKTRGSVWPTADALSFGRGSSLVVNDPSLESLAVLRPCLEGRGYPVDLLDPDDPLQGSRYNPLRLVAALHEVGDDASAEARAREVGTTLYPDDGGDNAIFSKAAGGAVAAVAWLVATLPEVPEGRRHLWSVVKTVLAGTREGTAPLKAWLRSFGEDSPAMTMSATFLSSEGKFESSILGTLHDGLQAFTSLNMRWLTSGSDLDVTAFVSSARPRALFVKTLAPGREENRVLSLFYAQHWAETQRLGRRRGLTPCWVLGDEWHSVPRWPLVHAVENARKFGLHYVMYLQSLSGLDQYRTPREDGKDAILSNCDLKALYRAGSDLDAAYFEKLSGMRTVRTESTGSSRGAAGGTSSASYSEHQMPLWPMGDILERDPAVDGVLVAKSASMGRPACKLEVPMADPTQTFVSRHLGTLGAPERERAVIGAELDRLEARARALAPSAKVEAWIPDFAALGRVAPLGERIARDEAAGWD